MTRRRGYRLVMAVAIAAQLYAHLVVTGAASGPGRGVAAVVFLFFAGGGAGALIVAALAEAVRLAGARPVARAADLVARGCVALAAVAMLVDVVAGPGLRPTAMAPWALTSFAALWIYLGNPVVAGYLAPRLVRGRVPLGAPARIRARYYMAAALAYSAEALAPRGRRRLRRLALTLLPAALLLGAIPGWILRHLGGQAGTALVGPLFVVSTVIVNVVAGLAVVIVVLSVHPGCAGSARAETGRALGRFLLVAIPPLGYCLLAEMQAGAADPGRLLVWLVLGGGVLVPFALLWFCRPAAAAPSAVAAALVVLGVLVERWGLVARLLGGAMTPAGSPLAP